MSDHEIRIPPAAIIRDRIARIERERKALHVLLKAALLDQGEYRRAGDEATPTPSGSECKQHPGIRKSGIRHTVGDRSRPCGEVRS